MIVTQDGLLAVGYARVVGDTDWHSPMFDSRRNGVFWWLLGGRRWPEYLLEWR